MNAGLNNRIAINLPAASRKAVGKRRSNIEIIADMLRVGETGAGKTEIMYTANMSFSQIQRYLTYLVDQGFVNRVEMDHAVAAYQVTDTGMKLLKAIDSLMAMLGPEQPEA